MAINFAEEFQRIEKRVRVLPVPLEISLPIVKIFKQWCESSGAEWSIQRMKDVKTDLLRLEAGQPAVSTWIKRSKGTDRTFAGPIGALEYWMFDSKRNFAKGIQLLMMYSWFVSEGLTLKQETKFITSLNAGVKPVSKQLIERLTQVIHRSGYEWKVSCETKPKPLVDMLPSPERFAPSPSQGKGFDTVPETSGAIVDSVMYLTHWEKGRRLIQDWYVLFESLFEGMEPFIDEQLGGKYGAGVHEDEHNEQPDFLPVGRISFIQEPGYKLRYVANPGRVFQRLLEPLGDALFGLAKTLPWDCTFDQAKAFPHVQEALGQGKTVYSFDLSSATDYFPLELQERILTSIVHDPYGYIPLWGILSRSDWYCKRRNGDEQFLKWSKGQPLGLYPSFAAFAVSHGFLLLALLDRPYRGEFFVLGDDVVILDDALASAYSRMMNSLDCPISFNKSLTGKIAEFAGRVITPDLVIPQLKWREPSDKNFVDLARLLGPNSLPLFKKKQRQILEIISEVPESLGGLGWNPQGKPIKERVPRWAWDVEEIVTALRTGSTKIRTENWYSSWVGTSYRSSWSQQETSIPIDTLEQRALVETLRMLGPSLGPMYSLMGKNLAKVYKALGIEPALPVSSSGRPNTQLEHWQHVLRIA
jgi:hypothetical protein